MMEFINAIFDQGEEICTSKDPFGTEVLYSTKEGAVFITINPLKERRLDINVTAYRNFLIEIDTMPLDEQRTLFRTIPITTLVYSGGKSLHGIISLQEPCKDREEYDALVRRIYEKVPQADKSAKNPSRFTRLPGAIRDNGKKQELLYVGKRVSRGELELWLGPAPEVKRTVGHSKLPGNLLKESTKYFLNFGARQGEWNSTLFKAVCDMTRCNWELPQIIEECENITGRLDSRDYATIRSAHRNAKHGSQS